MFIQWSQILHQQQQEARLSAYCRVSGPAWARAAYVGSWNVAFRKLRFSERLDFNLSSEDTELLVSSPHSVDGFINQLHWPDIPFLSYQTIILLRLGIDLQIEIPPQNGVGLTWAIQCRPSAGADRPHSELRVQSESQVQRFL